MDISHTHAVVWMDHHEARFIHFNRETSDEEVVAPVDPPHRLHIRSGSASGTHIRGDPAFFRDVAEALGATEAVLLVGPSTAKSELVAYLQRHLPLVGARVVGVETLARVTDHQLLAEGRRYFRKADLMTPQTS